MWKQMLRFGIVGALATFVHMVIGFLLIHAGLHALLANLVAFAVAFLVSFIGHLEFSFAGQDVTPAGALRKFALVALAGFGCNEAVLLTLLSQSTFTDSFALWASTGFAAIVTFAFSRTWAFQPIRPTFGQRSNGSFTKNEL